MKKVMATLVITSALVGCGKKDTTTSSGASTVSNAMTSATSSITTEANKISNLQTTASFTGLSYLNADHDNEAYWMPKAATAWWDTTTSLVNPVTNSGNITPKDWMGYQLKSDAKRTNGSYINVFGRLKSALEIFCAIGVASGVTSGYPSNGAHTITFDSATKTKLDSQCNMTLDSGALGKSVTLTISDTSTTTYYDKKIVIDLTNLGQGSQTYYMRSTSSTINLATVELNTNNSIQYLYRTIVELDKTNNKLKVEYISAPVDGTKMTQSSAPAVGYFHRLYYSKADGLGIDGNFIYGNGSADNAFILSGNPDASSPTYSLLFKDSNVDSDTYHTLCVNGSTGAVTDASNHCGGSNDSAYTLPSSNQAGLRSVFWNTTYAGTDYNSVSETTHLTFTGKSDFKSTGFCKN